MSILQENKIKKVILGQITSSKPMQIAVAISAVLVVGTAMSGVLIAEIQNAPLPQSVQLLLAFVLGAGSALMGTQQGTASSLQAQREHVELQNGNSGHIKLT